MFVLSACRDDGFDVALVPVFPTASAEISPSGNTFKWLSNGSGKFHFVLHNVDRGRVEVDTVLDGQQFTLQRPLYPNASYRWELSQGPAWIDVDFRTKDVPLLSLISPEEGVDLRPCCALTFRWQALFPDDFTFRLGRVTPAAVLLDTVVQDTELVVEIPLNPGADHYWEVEQNGVVLRRTFKTLGLERLYPWGVPGTWVHSWSTSTGGSGTLTEPGSIRLYSMNGGQAARVDSAYQVMSISQHSASGIHYFANVGGNIYELDINYLTHKIFFEYAQGGVSFYQVGRFDSM